MRLGFFTGKVDLIHVVDYDDDDKQGSVLLCAIDAKGHNYYPDSKYFHIDKSRGHTRAHCSVCMDVMLERINAGIKIILEE